MSRERFVASVRLVIFTLIVAFGGLVIWRGNTFADPHGLSYIVPLMCTLTGAIVMLTAFSVCYDREGITATNLEAH
jgi:hypothetical protein